MDFDVAGIFYKVALFIPPFILSLSFHEYAHAWTANKMGDSTARYLGRLSMDPMVHISWFGTVILPAIMLVVGGPLFGWANPVPVDMRNFKKPRMGMAIVAAAGPASNLVLATLFAGLLSLLPEAATLKTLSSGSMGTWGAAADMLRLAVLLNLALAFFNLLPLPPLDGSRIVQGFVSSKTAESLDRLEAYSLYIFLACFYLGIFKIVMLPISIGYGLLMNLFNVPAISPFS
jgi:Zn-dependent protease